jgi:transposase
MSIWSSFGDKFALSKTDWVYFLLLDRVNKIDPNSIKLIRVDGSGTVWKSRLKIPDSPQERLISTSLKLAEYFPGREARNFGKKEKLSKNWLENPVVSRRLLLISSEPWSVRVIEDATDRYFLRLVVEIKLETLPNNGQSVGINLGIANECHPLNIWSVGHHCHGEHGEEVRFTKYI